MRRSVLATGAALSVALLLTACSSSDSTTTGSATSLVGSIAASPVESQSGTVTPDSAGEVASSDSARVESSPAAPSDDSAPPGQPEPSLSEVATGSGAAAIVFDDTTSTWFATMCTSFAPMIGIERPSMTGDFEAQKSAAIDYYRASAAGATAIADALEGLPAPTIMGGQELADTFVSGMRATSQISTEQLSAVQAATDAASLKQAVDAAEAKIDESLGNSQVPITELLGQPGLREAIFALPDCAGMAGGN